MDLKPYETILNVLKNEEDLKHLVQENTECFFLEYKQSENVDYEQRNSLKGSDLNNIAKSISGFGNALGGIVIFGVDNSRKMVPFKGYKKFETMVHEAVSRSTNPNHEKVDTRTIVSDDNAGKGYVIIIIHQSHNRPLQVITNGANTHRYFYRTGESHVDIPHDVLIGMLGKKIPAKLAYQILLDKSASPDGPYSFNILLRNKSSVIAYDVWINLDINIPNVSVLQGPSIDIFTGQTMANSISIISIKDFRLPPQGYISPVGISIPKNLLDDETEYHFYFTFGCEGSRMNEFNAEFKGKEFNQISGSDFNDFIKFLQESSPGHIIERN